ncbi:ABC transporter ATP-binding protein [Microvirga sp. 2MCAF38]|uniref:ABC transporter ATP-binding protein n=1 Tax=Microvirga sp. 2MCAF38 TaxID=3232989 RepID=UPI003F9A8C24
MLEVGPLNAFYGDSHIVQNVTLAIGQSEGVAILGRNGVGKTTLFKSIMGGGPRVVGPVRHRGENIAAWPDFRRARRGLGFVPEDRRIYPHLTVAENIAMGRHATRPNVASYSVDEIFALFPMLADLRGRLGFELSGGQQQLLAIARAMFARPEYLLLDEPTEGLAPVIVEQLVHQLIDLRRRNGMALLVAEQNVWFARMCTERLYLLDSGRVVFEGSWAAFDSSADLQQRYLAV